MNFQTEEMNFNTEEMNFKTEEVNFKTEEMNFKAVNNVFIIMNKKNSMHLSISCPSSMSLGRVGASSLVHSALILPSSWSGCTVPIYYQGYFFMDFFVG